MKNYYSVTYKVKYLVLYFFFNPYFFRDSEKISFNLMEGISI